MPDGIDVEDICADPDVPDSPDYYNAHRAKQPVDGSGIVITNHASVVASITINPSRSIDTLFPEITALLVDEADQLEPVALSILSLSVSPHRLRLLAKNIINAASGPKTPAGRTPAILSRVIDIANTLYDRAQQICRPSKSAEAQNTAVFGQRPSDDNAYETDSVDLVHSDQLGHAIHLLSPLVAPLRDLGELFQSSAPVLNEAFENQQRYLRRRVMDAAYAIKQLSAMAEKGGGHFHRAIASRTPSRGFPYIQLVPTEVGLTLKRGIWANVPSSFSVSGTIPRAIGDDNYRLFAWNTGLTEQYRFGDDNPIRVVQYPPAAVKLSDDIRIVLPDSSVPPPNAKDPSDIADWRNYVAAMINAAALEPGGVLVLCTSYPDANEIAGRLVVANTGRTVHVQKKGPGIDHLARLLRQDPHNCIVFGTGDAWRGLDLPGDAVKSLVIPRLPFPSRSESIIKAKENIIRERNAAYRSAHKKGRARGLSSYKLVSEPKAYMTFRQGCGRLIRTETDSGKIWCADSRIVNDQGILPFRKALEAYAPPEHRMQFVAATHEIVPIDIPEEIIL